MRAMCVAAALLAAGSAAAADGPILLTRAKALQGSVTPGDTPGYPITLSRPGSYRLAGNLQVPAGKVGIDATGNYVTIDFAGFALLGGGSATTGILVSRINTSIENGTIANFKGDGILVDYPFRAESVIVDNMRVVLNGSGVNIGTVQYTKITNSNISRNDGVGVNCNAYCLVQNSTISGNYDTGVQIHSGSVLGNTIIDNGLTGIGGFGTYITGYGNNTLYANNGRLKGGSQIFGNMLPLDPNVCGNC